VSKLELSLSEVIDEMRTIQKDFEAQHGVNDIWSNSKIFEVLQANTLGHILIPGHSGSLDAKDLSGNEFEYKHFKESSSNHSWTFNDFSDATIKKLDSHVSSVFFGHIEDSSWPPRMDWAYQLTGQAVSKYLIEHTAAIRNARRMINLSARQLESRANARKTMYSARLDEGGYGKELTYIFDLIQYLESKIGVSNILTSNKFWEVLVSIPLGHKVNSEQGGRSGDHDAFDSEGRDYEYKVSSTRSWNFQDISENVLKKYHKCEAIILAIVNKPTIEVEEIWSAAPENVVSQLEVKLAEKISRFTSAGQEIRRLQVSLTAGDLDRIRAKRIH
jgi:hypothetical protein